MIGPGMMISDRYEIIDKVGSGGMADVYKAKDHRLNRFVAIKVLRQEYSSDAKFVAKFRAEAQSVAGLSHHPAAPAPPMPEGIGHRAGIPGGF